MCMLGLGKLRLPPNPSPRALPRYPTTGEWQRGPLGSKTLQEPPLRGTCHPASPAESWGIEGYDKDLPPSFQMQVLPWGTPAARHRLCGSRGAVAPTRPAAAQPAPHTCVHIHLRMSLRASRGLCSCHEASKLGGCSEATPLHPQKWLQPQRKGGQDLGSGSAAIFLHPSPACPDLSLSILGPRAPRGPLHPCCPHHPQHTGTASLARVAEAAGSLQVTHAETHDVHHISGLSAWMRKTSGCKKVSLRAAFKTLEGLLLPLAHISIFGRKVAFKNATFKN